MRVLMLGWEFLPYISGGFGTACHGLACAIVNLYADIVMMLPKNKQNISNIAIRNGEIKLINDGLKHLVFRKLFYKLPMWDTAARKCISIYNAVSEQAELVEQNL